jgi:hypothetical protein
MLAPSPIPTPHFALPPFRPLNPQLDSRGVSNLSALQSVAGAAALPYDFYSYSAPFDVDTPVLVLSSSAKSLLRTDVTVHLDDGAKARLAAGPGSIPDPSSALPAFLSRARSYVAAVRALPFAIPEALVLRVQADLAEAKGADRTLGEDDLSRWLLLARLTALSHGESTLTPERWAQARALEQARAHRASAAVGGGGRGAGGAAGAAAGSPGSGATPTRPTTGGMTDTPISAGATAPPSAGGSGGKK